MSKPIRALVAAQLCNPEWVSVPLVGWSHYRALAARADVDAHLVTQVRNRAAIERAGLAEGRAFTSLDTERVAAPVYKFGELIRGGKGKGWTTKTALELIGQRAFENDFWKRFGAELKAGAWDVVHQLTPLSPTLPPRLAKWCARAGVPFAWGPINGGLPWPKGWGKTLVAEREWLAKVRGAYRLLPGYGSSRRACSAILVASAETLAQMPARYHEKCFYVAENAVEPERFTARRVRRAALPLRLAFVGRLVPYKGADMVLDAATELLRAGKVEVEIIGDGPQRAELEAQANTVGRGVALAGWVAHEDVQHRLADKDAFVFPSIREFGGAVVLEAAAVGLPSVIVDYGGPGELVTDATGWKLPLGDRAAIVAALKRTLEALVADPSELDRRGDAALTRCHERFTWDAKAAQTVSVWRWLARGAPKPHLPPPPESELAPIERGDAVAHALGAAA